MTGKKQKKQQQKNSELENPNFERFPADFVIAATIGFFCVVVSSIIIFGSYVN